MKKNIRTLSPEEVLKIWNIENFQHLNKKDAIRITSKIAELDPEVALKIIEQFPDFTLKIKEMIISYTDLVKKIISSEDADSAHFYEATEKIMGILENELKKASLNAEDRAICINGLLQLAQMMTQENEARRKHNDVRIHEIGKYIALAIVASLSVLGITIYRDHNDNDNDDADDAA